MNVHLETFDILHKNRQALILLESVQKAGQIGSNGIQGKTAGNQEC